MANPNVPLEDIGDPSERNREPSPPSYDSDWLRRVERAKSAREDGRKAREGKPIVFPVDSPRSLT